MYHSITFGDKNTWTDWHLVPSSRPVINPPKPKVQYVDIPGADGSIDLTESLAGRPVFSDREGSLEFYVLNDLDGVADYNWSTVYEEIMAYLHGKFMRMSLEDETVTDDGTRTEYFYEGRFSVNSWKSNEDRSTITIDYRLGPYKYEKRSSGITLVSGDIDVTDGTNKDDTAYARTSNPIIFNAGDAIAIDGYCMNFFKYAGSSASSAYYGGDHNNMILAKNGKLTFAERSYCRFSFKKLDGSEVTSSDRIAMSNAIRLYKGGKI